MHERRLCKRAASFECFLEYNNASVLVVSNSEKKLSSEFRRDGRSVCEINYLSPFRKQ